MTDKSPLIEKDGTSLKLEVSDEQSRNVEYNYSFTSESQGPSTVRDKSPLKMETSKEGGKERSKVIGSYEENPSSLNSKFTISSTTSVISIAEHSTKIFRFIAEHEYNGLRQYLEEHNVPMTQIKDYRGYTALHMCTFKNTESLLHLILKTVLLTHNILINLT